MEKLCSERQQVIRQIEMTPTSNSLGRGEIGDIVSRSGA